jgi:hypothetical protein
MAMKTRILAFAALMAASLAVLSTSAEAQRAGYAGRGYGGTPPPGGGYRGGTYPGGGYYGGGYRGGTYPGGGYYGGGYRGGGYYGGAWRGYGYWGRPVAPYWRAGWGWGWGWGGWGWGVGWYPGWYGGWYSPGYWGWSVGAPVVIAPSTGAWVLPPSASTVYIERDVETTTAPPAPQSQPQQWWYWCASSRAYYPYVESCAEAWQRVEPRTPPGTR